MKKGFILTTDVAISIALIGMILFAISQLKPTDIFPELEAKRLATDAVAILDYNGVLSTYDKNSIESNLSRIIPPNLNISMIIKKFNSTAMMSQLQVNANITENYLSGKWWLTSVNGSSQFFYLVDYRVKFL